MFSGYVTATRAAAHDLLAHEHADQNFCRRIKPFDFACLGLAFLGTVSTVAAWEKPPARQAAVTDRNSRDKGDFVQPSQETFDFGAFVQVAGR